jgi:diguanylate cyclase (GGDEF)-like protein
MSHALEPVDGRALRYQEAQHVASNEPRPRRDDRAPRWDQVVWDMVTDAVLLFREPSAKLVHVNRAACRCLGYSPPQLLGISLAEIAPQTSCGKLGNRVRSILRGLRAEARARIVFRHRDGLFVPIRCRMRAWRSWPDSLVVVVGEILDTARRGEITASPNRDGLWRQLQCEARRARRSDYRFAVFFVDVDRFKNINDSFGHLAGDQVLRAVARRLAASIRPADILMRYGGDEFVVLMKDVRQIDDIRQIAQRIVRRLTATVTRHRARERQVPVSVSVGVAICAGRRASAADAIDRADRAMYRAKTLGRNGQFVIDESTACCKTFANAGVRTGPFDELH